MGGEKLAPTSITFEDLSALQVPFSPRVHRTILTFFYCIPNAVYANIEIKVAD